MRAEALASPDGKLIGGTLAGETWGQVLARDVRIVADEVDAIAFLPDWEYSRGARLEAFVGLLCNKTFWYYVEGDDALHRVSAETVRSILRVCMP